MGYIDLDIRPETATPIATDPAVHIDAVRFSALEWSVVALAERDSLASLHEPGRLSIAMSAIFGLSTDTRMADAKLEALRRIAVLAWHHGWSVPVSELRAFLTAGFSPDQYELLQDSIAEARFRQRSGTPHRRTSKREIA